MGTEGQVGWSMRTELLLSVSILCAYIEYFSVTMKLKEEMMSYSDSGKISSTTSCTYHFLDPVIQGFWYNFLIRALVNNLWPREEGVRKTTVITWNTEENECRRWRLVWNYREQPRKLGKERPSEGGQEELEIWAIMERFPGSRQLRAWGLKRDALLQRCGRATL